MEHNNKISADEFLESLNGFEEIAIEKAFGSEVMALGQNSPTKFLRSLVFIQQKRDGKNDFEAKDAVMNMSLGEVNAYFSEDDEVMPEEPVTEAGEGVGQPA